MFDLAIVGSSFTGSLMAMIARRLGLRVVIIERGSHPRFAIGESSTPLANLLLEELADTYDLPRLRSFCKWGIWQRTHPEIACGLKRGFTFYHHSPGIDWESPADHTRELMVAASPSDELADTHWYRPDFDHFLLREAQSLGAEYIDRTQLDRFEVDADHVSLTGARDGRPVDLNARWLIDASGPRGFIHSRLRLRNVEVPGGPVVSALYTHFRDVARWHEIFPTAEIPPYPPDDAALHHVFDEGWMWVLRFNNGITSAGFTCSPLSSAPQSQEEMSAFWKRRLQRFPGVGLQFHRAREVYPWQFAPQLAFRTERVFGDRWLMLPGTAGVVDPLLSTGFVLSLLGIQRTARLLENGFAPARLKEYELDTFADLDAVMMLVGALYGAMGFGGGSAAAFERYRHLALLYFAAVTFSETRRRLGHNSSVGFLLRNDPKFFPRATELIREAPWTPPDTLGSTIGKLIEPYNVAGLGNPARRHWYPVDVRDLFASAGKLNATSAEIRAMLERVGFSSL
jgi:FADH2 O2-dependent halogenase